MINIVRSSTIMLCLVSLISCQSSEYLDYEKAEGKLKLLKQQEKYNEAISLLLEISEKFPDKEFETSKELALIYGKIGQYEKSLKIWETGHQKGFFYGIFTHFPIYEPFKQFSKFDDIVNEDNLIRKEAIENSKTVFEVILPENFNHQKYYPLFIILHGGGSSNKRAMKYWNSSILNKDYIKAFIQSYLYMDMKTFGWGIKDERARAEIKDCYNEIIKNYPIDRENVIIGGMSAGGYTALDVAIHAILPVSGFVAVCPETELEDYDKYSIQKASEKGLKGIIISGEQDYFLAPQKEVYGLLKRFGLQVRFEIVSDSGHEYPKNFENYINRSIQFIR